MRWVTRFVRRILEYDNGSLHNLALCFDIFLTRWVEISFATRISNQDQEDEG